MTGSALHYGLEPVTPRTPPVNETIGATTASSRGTTVTASGSTNTKGTYTEISSSTPIAADSFTLMLSRPSGAAIFMLDIAVGGSGAESVILSNIAFDVPSTNGFCSVTIPLPISSGTRVAARVQSTGASASLDVSMVLHQHSVFAPLGITTATTYGADTSTSSGTALTFSGSNNTKNSTWNELSSSTTGRMKMLLFLCGLRAAAIGTSGSALVDIGVGASSSESAIFSNLNSYGDTNTDRWFPMSFLLPVDIAAGSRLSARQQMSANNLMDVIAIGFS